METDLTLAAFSQMLESFGADPGRWPASLKPRVDALLAQNLEARRCLAEAEALDRLLDRAPKVDGEREAALASRIFAAAMQEPQLPAERDGNERERGPSNVVAWPGRQAVRAAGGKRGDEAGPVQMPQVAAPGWRNAALLAASLVLGVYIGWSNASSPVARDMLAAVGVVSDSGTSTAALDQFYLSVDDEESL